MHLNTEEVGITKEALTCLLRCLIYERMIEREKSKALDLKKRIYKLYTLLDKFKEHRNHD